MATAHEVAAGLRQIAKGLDANPEAVIPDAYIAFMAYQREPFVELARILPRPLKKHVDDGQFPQLKLTYKSPGVTLMASVPRDKACRVVREARAAEYECDPILSLEDEAEVGA